MGEGEVNRPSSCPLPMPSLVSTCLLKARLQRMAECVTGVCRPRPVRRCGARRGRLLPQQLLLGIKAFFGATPQTGRRAVVRRLTQPYEVGLGSEGDAVADLVTAPQPRQIRIRAVGD